VLGIFASLPIIWPQPQLLAAVACVALVGVPCFVLFARARLAHAERIDPLAFYRQRLTGKLWREALLVVFFSLAALFTYWLSGGHAGHGVAGHAADIDFWPSHRWGHLRLADALLLATSAVSWWAAMHLLFVRLPETRREQIDLR
jgi:hypothetical protein